MAIPRSDLYKEIPRKALKVTYKGGFDFKKLYQFLHDWFVDEGFEADDSLYEPSGGDMWETFYWERRSLQGVTDYIIWWRLKKSPDEQSSKWVEYRFSIDFLGLALAKTDVMHEGKKIGANKGEMNIDIKPKIIVDPNKLWKKDSFVGKFSSMFLKRTYRKELKYHKDVVDDIAFRLQEAIKNFLGLNTFGDYGEPFHPEKGYGWA